MSTMSVEAGDSSRVALVTSFLEITGGLVGVVPEEIPNLNTVQRQGHIATITSHYRGIPQPPDGEAAQMWEVNQRVVSALNNRGRVNTLLGKVGLHCEVEQLPSLVRSTAYAVELALSERVMELSGGSGILPPFRARHYQTTRTSTNLEQRLSRSDLEWQEFGACKDVDPEIFFRTGKAETAKAKAFCGRCLVSSQCLEWALEKDEPYGVFGGMTRPERRKLARRRNQGK